MYSLVVDRKRLNHVRSFSIKRSITQFVDTFNVTLGNYGGNSSRNVYLGDILNFIRGSNDTIFSGVVESREISASDIEINLSVSGRDTICHLTESNAPLLNFKNTTDNAIIEKVMAEVGDFTLDLGEAHAVSEYTINPGNTIGSVIDGVAKLNDTFTWKRGDVIIKRAISETGTPKKAYYIEADRKNILNIRTTESMTNAKTKISVYSHSGGRSKGSLKGEKIVDLYASSAFQTLITSQNGHTGSQARFDRPFNIAASGKNLGEVNRQLDVAVKQAEPRADIMIKVKDFQDFELNDIIAVVWDTVGINNNFVIVGLTFEIEEDNTQTTTINLQPLGTYPK